MVNYTVPGHVIGGSEPRSWKVTVEAKKQARISQNQRSPRPKATGRTIDARFESDCYWCGKPMRKGERITLVELAYRSRWIQRDCAA
jgi:hypothetical protein